EIYNIAKHFMATTGNKNQWINDYPTRELILSGIKEGKQYILICENQIVGTFFFSVEEDEAYTKIHKGEWLNVRPYGVVHRLASNRIYKGVADSCLKWCFEQCGNIRVDTHRDNFIMQNILKKNGYLQCGVIGY
ncbi:GNAT family N-acetyltransferase, partial [Parabacteroides sp. OttesenSCG-928-G06]|nr:GNAT family N-acetyltransferase [Parabacteroides sp. OttesenSCG-928-G06]